jgi:hypothetical protein
MQAAERVGCVAHLLQDQACTARTLALCARRVSDGCCASFKRNLHESSKHPASALDYSPEDATVAFEESAVKLKCGSIHTGGPRSRPVGETPAETKTRATTTLLQRTTYFRCKCVWALLMTQTILARPYVMPTGVIQGTPFPP